MVFILLLQRLSFEIGDLMFIFCSLDEMSFIYFLINSIISTFMKDTSLDHV